MTRLRLAILMAFMLAVAGCGGGSGVLRSETSARQVETVAEAGIAQTGLTESTISQGDSSAEEDALVEERRQAEQAITGAEAEDARQQAAADMAAQEEAKLATAPEDAAARISYVPYLSAGAHTEFDGRDVRVHLPDYFLGYPVVLSSVRDEVDGTAVPSRVEGYSQRTWTLFDDGSLAVVSVRWHDGDDSDYLAAGWWVRETPYSSEAEADVFVDGPELRGPLPDSMTLPLRGQAVYYGEAAGVYQTEGGVVCAAFPCEIPTSNGAGEFAADAKLVADFARGDIEGCVGCRQGIQFTPAVYDLDGGAIERGDTVTRDYLFWLHRAGFLESPYTLGAFAGELTVAPLGGRAAGYGFWQGRFSNLSDSTGSPRLLGATLHGGFEDESTTTRFSGVLSAESTTFGGSR